MNKNYQIDLQSYLKNPNICFYCNKPILVDKNRTLSKTKRLKFCSISCGVSYNNEFKKYNNTILYLVEMEEAKIDNVYPFDGILYNKKIININYITEGIEKDITRPKIIKCIKKTKNKSKKTPSSKEQKSSVLKMNQVIIQGNCILHGSNKTIRCAGLHTKCKDYLICLDIAIENQWSGWTSTKKVLH